MNHSIPLKPFYMIRHGESIANHDGYFSGNLDVKLTAQGIEQAKQAQVIFDNLEVKPSIIIHSHLSRARDTAAIMNENQQAPMVETPLLGEHHFGDWEKQPWDNVRPAFMDGQDPPNGETRIEFNARVKKGFIYALSRAEMPLIVCHGGVFRGLFENFGIEIHGIENCALYQFNPHKADANSFPWDYKKL